MKRIDRFMKTAITEANNGIRQGHGGPFGAVIAKGKNIIAVAHNEVIKNMDPTCHAEIQAIRKAVKVLKTFNLSDCELYTSCEPCLMCLPAVYLSGIRVCRYGCDRDDAARIGFDDLLLHEIVAENIEHEEIRFIKMSHPENFFWPGTAVIKDGKTIAIEKDRVFEDQDPTAHSIMRAIGSAAKILGSFDLSGCEIYTSCKPCLMCFSALYWARIKKVFFVNTLEDESENMFFPCWAGNTFDIKRSVLSTQINRDECLVSFRKYEKLPERIIY